MNVTVDEFLEKTGLGEALAPGQIKYKHHPNEKSGSSYTMVYDWKTDLNKIRVEVRPGLTGQMPDKKELAKYAVWLQTLNFMELDLNATKKTKH
ncbi:MAG TPA: hypothetical protein VIN59_04990 [Alphaproteobacteria bacterium]